MRPRTLLVAALLLGTTGCEIAGCRINNMVQQPRVDPYEASELFADGAAARPPVPGAVTRDRPAVLPEVVEVDAGMLVRGRDRFQVFCSPCHDLAGTGAGMIVRRGYPTPPSFHSPRLRAMSDATILGVIRNGRGKMPPYGPQVGDWDRVAIVAWIRVLQRSQAAALADLPAKQQQQLLAQPEDAP